MVELLKLATAEAFKCLRNACTSQPMRKGKGSIYKVLLVVGISGDVWGF